MSGGAVVNMRGELVGLTTAAASPVAYDVQAGYAIPMDTLGRRIAETLKQGKEVEYGFLGIKLDENVPNGVKEVSRGTPADKADLLAHDVILAVGDRVLEPEDSLTMALSSVPPGQSVTLKVRRNDAVLEKTVLVSKYPVDGPVIATNRPAPWRGLRVDFTSVLGSGSFDLLDSMSRGGVGIVEVEPGSPADQAGLRKGMILTSVDGAPIPTPADFARVVASKADQDVRLTAVVGSVVGAKTIVVKK
jgi:S1-C subfamily serine protease